MALLLFDFVQKVTSNVSDIPVHHIRLDATTKNLILVTFGFISLAVSEINIGTECDCTVTVVSTSAVYDSTTYGSGDCSSESSAPLDVWNDIGVGLEGTSQDGGTSDTFDYRIDCALPCSISQVVKEGAAFCGGDTTLQLWDADRTTLLAQVDPDISDGS